MIRNKNLKLIIVVSLFFNTFIIIDPVYVRQILQNHQKFTKINLLFANHLMLEKGLAFSDGMQWKRKRTFLSPQFHFNSLISIIPFIKEKSAELIEQMSNKSNPNVFESFKQMDLKIINYMFFGESQIQKPEINGRSIDEENIRIVQKNMTFIIKNMYQFLKYIIFGADSYKYCNDTQGKEFLNELNNYNSVVETFIRDRMEELQSKSGMQATNFMDLYLEEYTSQEKNTQLSKKSLQTHEIVEISEIIQQFNTLIFAGTETTSNLVSFALYEISMNNKIKEQLAEEIQKNISSFDNLTHSDLNKLDYLQATIKETLRKYPTLPTIFPRKSIQDTQLQNLFIPKNTIVLAQLIVSGLYENFEIFDPERFLNQNQENNGYLPFSSGPRNCIGQHLAIIVAKIQIIYCILNFDIIKNQQITKLTFNVSPLQCSEQQELFSLQRKK